MAEISFIWPLTGGLMIGLSAAIYLLFNGRIAGISGLTASAFGWADDGINVAAICFLGGTLAGAALGFAYAGHGAPTVIASPVILVIGGLAVGYGTRLGSGCTSGHGVCGLARLSPRSIVATGTFMVVAGITVFVTRHLIGGL